jgi:hypothetical protein
MLEVQWNPTFLSKVFEILNFFLGKFRKFIWIIFAAQSWALWKIQNKFLIEGVFPNQPVDCLFKIVILLQQWRPLTISKDLELMDKVIGMSKHVFNAVYSHVPHASNN